MGREHNLPPVFARIHPTRLTPFVAVLVTGALMLAAALAPADRDGGDGGRRDVPADVHPGEHGGDRAAPHAARSQRAASRMPLFPVPALIAVAANAALVLYMISFNPMAVWTAFGWIVAGLLAYYMLFRAPGGAGERRATSCMRRRSASTTTPSWWPCATSARRRSWAGSARRSPRRASGGLLAAHMLEVPRPLSLNEGRTLIESGRGYFETIRRGGGRAQGRHPQPDHDRAARRPRDGGLVAERGVDFIVLGWSGKTKRGRRSAARSIRCWPIRRPIWPSSGPPRAQEADGRRRSWCRSTTAPTAASPSSWRPISAGTSPAAPMPRSRCCT